MSRVTTSLVRRLGQAAYACAAIEVSGRALTVLLSIAVARALDPGQVGILGLAVIMVGVLSQIAFYVETACVTSRSPGSDSGYAIAAVGIRGAVTIASSLIILFPLQEVARLLAGDEATTSELVSLVHLLLWQLVLEVAGTYPRVLLQRRLQVVPVATANFLAIVSHVCLSVVLLAWGWGAEGVVWACLASVGLSGGFLWTQLGRGSWRGIGGIEAGQWWEAVLSSVKVFVGGFLGYVVGRVDNLMVAGVLGPAAMSFYAMAWNAARVPVAILYQTFGTVLAPAVAHIGEDEASIWLVLSRSFRHSYLILIPLCAFLITSGPSLVALVLGPKWLPMVSCLRIMAVTILVAPILAITNALVLGSGRQHLTGLASAAQLFVLLALIVPLTRRWGIVGAAIADFASTIVLTFAMFMVCRPSVPHVRHVLLRSFLLPAAAAAVAGVISWRVGLEFGYGMVRLVSEALAVAIVYGVLIILPQGPSRFVEIAMKIRDVMRQETVPPGRLE